MFCLNLFANSFENIKTFNADFTQTIINSANKQINYQGTLYIKYPFMVLWKYKDPIIKNIYMTNSSVTIIEPELEQAIVTTMENEINILKLIKDAKQIDNNIYEAYAYNTLYTLELRDGILNSVSYTDEIDNKITIKFTNIKQNNDIPNETFKFSIPDDFDIIRK